MKRIAPIKPSKTHKPMNFNAVGTGNSMDKVLLEHPDGSKLTIEPIEEGLQIRVNEGPKGSIVNKFCTAQTGSVNTIDIIILRC